MHTKLPGSGLASRSRTAPTACSPARSIVSVVSPAAVAKQQTQQPHSALDDGGYLITAISRDRHTCLPSAGVVVASNSSELPPPEPASADVAVALTTGLSSHRIELSDTSSSESDAEDVKQLACIDGVGLGTTNAALTVLTAGVTRIGSLGGSSEATGAHKSSKIRPRRKGKKPARSSTTASTALADTSSTNPLQKQALTPHRIGNNQEQNKQYRVSVARKLVGVTTSVLVMVWAVTASSMTRSCLGKLSMHSSSSSNAGLSVAAATGNPAWGAVGGLLGPTFRAAQHANPRYRSPAASRAAAAEAGDTAAANGSWLSRSSSSYNKALRMLQLVINLFGRAALIGDSNSNGISRDGLHVPAAAAGTSDVAVDVSNTQSNKVTPAGDLIKMYAVADESAVSPYKGATWGAVISHIAKRLAWNNPRFSLEVLTMQQLKSDSSARDSLAAALSGGSSSSNSRSSPIFVGISITDPDVAAFLSQATAKLPTALFWDSTSDLDRSSRVDGFAPATATPLSRLLAEKVGFSSEARASRVLKTISSLWGRHTSDDLLFIWLVLLNEYATPVPEVANTTKGTDLQSLICMIKNCGSKIKDCVTDTTCKAGLDCLEGCAFNDQVCQYRCIVSYETPKFEQFALCILQLHNCRGLDAKMPMMPDPAPMASWRGAPLTHEVAESLLIGWREAGAQVAGGLQVKPYSWLVAAGKNPAYDFFPAQHQLYSYGKGRGQMWYEPVFKAVTLDGHEVWRRRRYRVRRGTTPGTFYYSVLDNGVTSNEYWRIIDCAEDLTYCLFYYSGAAAAAGLSYSGAVLATQDGLWPAAYTERVHEALGRAGIEPWELSSVDNSAQALMGAPL